MSLDTATQIAVAAQDAGVTPVVRVPAGNFATATRALDGGAMGIVLPHVDNGDQASAFADACRYPPLGRRSVAAGLPQVGFGTVTLERAVALIEPQILLFPMVETQAGARNVRAIAATPGVDGILLGLTDLSLELGLPGEVGHPAVRAVVKDTIAACAEFDKWVGVGGVGDLALISEYVGQGMGFALIGNDLGLLMGAVSARVTALAVPIGDRSSG